MEIDPTVKKVYAFYHQRWWCYRQLFFRFKWKHAFLNALVLITVCVRMVIGPLFECGIATTCLTAFAAFIKGWTDFKNFSTKVDMCRFAYITYDDLVLIGLLRSRWLQQAGTFVIADGRIVVVRLHLCGGPNKTSWTIWSTLGGCILGACSKWVS